MSSWFTSTENQRNIENCYIVKEPRRAVHPYAMPSDVACSERSHSTIGQKNLHCYAWVYKVLHWSKSLVKNPDGPKIRIQKLGIQAPWTSHWTSDLEQKKTCDCPGNVHKRNVGNRTSPQPLRAKKEKKKREIKREQIATFADELAEKIHTGPAYKDLASESLQFKMLREINHPQIFNVAHASTEYHVSFILLVVIFFWKYLWLRVIALSKRISSLESSVQQKTY